MNKKTASRILALVLTVVMVIGLMPVSVFATEADSQNTTSETAVVKFDANGGIGEYEDQVVTLGEKVAKPEEDPTHETDEFAYWTADLEEVVEWNFEENVVDGDMTLYAVYTAVSTEDESEAVSASENETVPETEVTEVAYTVQHYLETAEGYVLDSAYTDTKFGIVGELTTAEAKKIETYTAQPFDQIEITADGAAVVSIYYAKNPATAGVTVGSGLASAGMTIITDDESTLAPGVKLNEIVMYDANGKRVEMYVTTADSNVDTVQFYANYKDNQCSVWGMQTLSEQVAAMEANYEEPFKVVAGINASYYNVTTGKPTGTFVMEGVDVTTESEGNNYAFFAVLKDGTVMIGAKGEYSKYKGQIKEAIGGYVHIVKDGAVVSGLDKTTKYPRQTIGLTADGKVILMTADGSQTQTVGLTYQEQAEVMLALGCVEALHLDGGNSATFGTVPEGSDKFITTNSPSGGAERAVSNTFMIVSTAVADGTFDHAVITGEYEYQLPYTTTTYSAIGVDAANGAAQIPDTVVWTLSDDSFGTIKNGMFVSNGKLGDVDIQMSDNGKVVGTKTVHVVHPTEISFAGSETTVPYGKSAPLTVTAMYGNNEVLCEADNFEWVVDPAAAGTLDGFQFTACADETVTSGVVTASYKYAELESTSITVKFGKGSEVLFDFEDGDISDWRGTLTIDEWMDEQADLGKPMLGPDKYSNNIYTQYSDVFLASEENGGKVKNGNYALGFRMNHLNLENVNSWVYNYLYYTGETKVLRDVANGNAAVRIGMWVYVPDVTNVAFRLVRSKENSDGTLGISYSYMTSDYDGVKTSYATNYAIPEAGWIYVYYDLTDLDDSVVQTTSQYSAAHATANNYYYPAFLQLFSGSATDTMEDIIYYIDDITLDFSEVTEDRDAPVISNICVSTDGTNDMALNGQTVNSNLLSFSASVTDNSGNANTTGLDYATAKIYVDGMDVSGNAGFKTVSGIMSLNNVNLTDGEHTVTFVIFDKQGNETRVTKSLTVDGSAGNAKVYLTGHNDGNHTPKAGSVYYIDVKASDAAQIEALTITLKLNSANKFEYQNIICADGVTAEASYDALDFQVTVKLTHDGTLSGDAVLASIPVRVWAWDEAVTGKTASAQFATGAIPTINIEVESVCGEVTLADDAYNGYITGFADALNVATELDNKTNWHAHSAVTVEDQTADCTHAGYTGRTYCAGCASVVNWGTVVPAAGHSYAVVDGVRVCTTCGNTEAQNGLVQVGEKYYYFINGSAVSGWNMIGDNWHYFDTTTMEAVSGTQVINSITYEFEENGKLISGVWAKTLYGTRYYYGPGYHKTGWQTIDGKDYCFDNGYRLEGGWQLVLESQQYRNWYYFDEDGVCADKNVKPEDGVYTDRNGLAGALDGTGHSGLREINGKFYYFNHHGYAQNNGTYAGRLFKDDYAAYTGFHEKNGVKCYYINGVTATNGLYSIDDEYYVVTWGGVVRTDGKYYCSATFCNLPVGTYWVDAEGKMLNGIIEMDGISYLYVNGQPASNGLYKVGDDYYFSTWGGVLKTDGRYNVSTSYCDLSAGNYTFGVDGKMLNGVVDVDGKLILYVNGVTATKGLYEVNGEYYYSYWGGELKTNGRYYVSTSYCDLPAGNYTVDAYGKVLDGVVEVNGKLYLYVNGTTATKGLYEVDGEYYYSYWGGELKTDGRYYVSTTFCDLPAGNYTLGADGKVLDGVVDDNGKLYLYVNGSTASKGLFNLDGAYYFSDWGGVLKTAGTYYVSATYCGELTAGNYAFGADGKMLDGVVEIDGVKYLYINGTTASNGLYKFGEDYYLSTWGGVLKTDGRYYIGTTYCDLPAGNYTTDENGKILNGFMTKADGIYYFVNGSTPAPGLIYVDGDYYYVNWGGKLVTNQTFYVSRTNGYTIPMNYTFDENGRLVV